MGSSETFRGGGGGGLIPPVIHTHTHTQTQTYRHKRKTAIFNEKLKKASGMQLLILFLQYRVRGIKAQRTVCYLTVSFSIVVHERLSPAYTRTEPCRRDEKKRSSSSSRVVVFVFASENPSLHPSTYPTRKPCRFLKTEKTFVRALFHSSRTLLLFRAIERDGLYCFCVAFYYYSLIY